MEDIQIPSRMEILDKKDISYKNKSDNMVKRTRMKKTGRPSKRKTRLERSQEKAESKFQKAVKTVAKTSAQVLSKVAEETVKTLKAGLEAEKETKARTQELLRKEGLLDEKSSQIEKKAEEKVDKIYTKALTEIKVIERKK